MTDLAPLHRDIEDRVRHIREAHPDWPCGKGCDRCCRSLADLPRLTPSEWALLQAGLDALAPDTYAAIRARAATMTRGPDGYVCPLLDSALGICPVYAQRPVACRTYGYYVARDKGLFCRDIEGRVASGALDDVIWGSQAAVDRQLVADGEALPLPVWFDLREAGRPDTADAP